MNLESASGIDGRRERFPAWRALVVLLLICLAVRIVVGARAVSPARDAFGFIEAALQFEELGWPAVHRVRVHPLYPFTLAWAHRAWTWLTGMEGPFGWWRAGQAWSAACQLGFVAAAFAAGCIVWNQRVAFWGCLAIGLVPRMVSHGVDIVADNLMALLWMTAFLPLAWNWQRPSAKRFQSIGIGLAAGSLAGFAYWTHLSALTFPASYGLAWLVTQAVPRWRRRWSVAAGEGAGIAIAFGVVVGVYAGQIGALSPRLAAREMLGETLWRPTADQPARDQPSPTLSLPVVRPDTQSNMKPFAKKAVNLVPRPYEGIERYERTTWLESIGRVTRELGEETRIWLLLFAGLTLVRGMGVRMPAGAFALAAIACCVGLMLALQIKSSYVAGRYALPVLPFVGMLGARGIELAMQWVGDLPRLWGESVDSAMRSVSRRRLAVAGLAILVSALYLPRLAEPLHLSRYPQMQAALWLREHAEPDASVFDPTVCSPFFAERPSWRATGERAASVLPRYAVIDPRSVYRWDERTHQAIAWVNQVGRPVARLPRRPGSDDVGAWVFEIPPDRVATHPAETGNDR